MIPFLSSREVFSALCTIQVLYGIRLDFYIHIVFPVFHQCNLRQTEHTDRFCFQVTIPAAMWFPLPSLPHRVPLNIPQIFRLRENPSKFTHFIHY